MSATEQTKEQMDYFETLERWKELKEAISALQAEERALRQGIFEGTFPNPDEGTNKYELPDGSVLKGVYKINRNVIDAAAIDALPKKQREAIFRRKYDLNTTAYRGLDDEERNFIDQFIQAKPGLPSLDLVPPKPSPEEVAP